jgi:hypothetical protein
MLDIHAISGTLTAVIEVKAVRLRCGWKGGQPAQADESGKNCGLNHPDHGLLLDVLRGLRDRQSPSPIHERNLGRSG